MRHAFFSSSSRIRVGLLLALVVALVTARAARAQVLYGSLVGMVHDSTGAVVPGGAVTVVNAEPQRSAKSLMRRWDGRTLPAAERQVLRPTEVRFMTRDTDWFSA